ncbi:hypothetical protein [Arthrobacter sp. H14-L1]|uniref:hypothetical protein n=1 Tax=Arthrobacter sp. H14-L1 TaxID=2996697 RepID=UPI00226FD548|nr:hypothetical protein [Arthrobacter sp. H14-L1]MCY0905178.1 hypothetical protein [Arthrobacter sp. H14-L1]
MGQASEKDRPEPTTVVGKRGLLFSADGSVIGFADRQLLGAEGPEPHGEHALWPETIADQERDDPAGRSATQLVAGQPVTAKTSQFRFPAIRDMDHDELHTESNKSSTLGPRPQKGKS